MKLNTNAVELTFDESERKLYADGVEVPFSVRRLGDLKDVIFNRNFINKNNENDILYRMYRNAGVSKNATVFEAHNIRYDVTVIEKYDMGGEFNKTLGHYHPECDNGLDYPEIYEVLYGEVLYLLQKRYEKGVYDTVLIHAKKGDKVIMPPNYGHISINIGKTMLIEANLVNSTFQSEYDPIKEKRGGTVYVTDKKDIVINHNYEDVTLSYKDAERIGSLDYSKSLYDEYIAHPEHFIFLNRPEYLMWKHSSWEISSQHF